MDKPEKIKKIAFYSKTFQMFEYSQLIITFKFNVSYIKLLLKKKHNFIIEVLTKLFG